MADSPYLRPIDDRKDVKIFVLSLIGGLFGIILLKMVLHANQVQVTAFPCTILILYGLFVWKTKRYQLRGDRAGDSIYYLGFLYTLLSLALSLYEFVYEGMDARNIVGNLGIALFTTLIGLAGRVLLTQLREDPVEIEESARLALAEAASQVRAELSHMVEDIGTFRRTTVQTISESSEEISRETNRALTESVVSFTESSRAVVGKIGEVFAEFGDNAKKLNRVSSGTVTALEKLMERVEAIEAPQSLISAKFTPLVDQLKSFLDSYSQNVSAQVTSTEKLKNSVDQTALQAMATIRGLESVSEAAAKAAEGITTQTATVSAEIKNFASSVLEMLKERSQLEEVTLDKLDAVAAEGVRTIISLVETAVNELHRIQSASNEAVESKLTAIDTRLERATQVMSAFLPAHQTENGQNGELSSSVQTPTTLFESL